MLKTANFTWINTFNHLMISMCNRALTIPRHKQTANSVLIGGTSKRRHFTRHSATAPPLPPQPQSRRCWLCRMPSRSHALSPKFNTECMFNPSISYRLLSAPSTLLPSQSLFDDERALANDQLTCVGFGTIKKVPAGGGAGHCTLPPVMPLDPLKRGHHENL